MRVRAFVAPWTHGNTVGLGLILAAIASAQSKPPKSALDYFNELRAANEFTHFSDTYACFADDDVPSFAVISRGSDVIDEMKHVGTTPDKLVLAAKHMLFVKTYYKGVGSEMQMYDPVGASGTDWELLWDDRVDGKTVHWMMVYSITWATGRYRLDVYRLNHSKVSPGAQRYGKCELIHPEQ